MATFSRIVRFSHNNELAVGVIVSLYRTDNGEKAFIGDEITDSNGFVEFTSVDPAGEYEITARHNVGETLYNALNQPFLTAGFDPATISPNFWVKSDESGLFTFRGETDFVSSTGAKSPATLALTQATETHQPELISDELVFVKANQTYMEGQSGSGAFMSGATAKYTVSIAIRDWVEETNASIMSNNASNNRFQIGRGGSGDINIRTAGTIIASVPGSSGAKIITLRVDHEAGIASVLFNNESIVNASDITPDSNVSTGLRLGGYTAATVLSTFKLRELVTAPSYVDEATLAGLHAYNMRHFPS